MNHGQAPRGSAEPLDTRYAVALLDLDGVVYLSGSAIPPAADALHRAAAPAVAPARRTKRGRQRGKGSLIQVVATATGVRPLVAGKPEPPLHTESVLRTGARHPLVVGDRLDTDIEAAHRVGADSLLVLTGVTGPAEAVLAPPSQRPTYLAEDLAGLLEPHPGITETPPRFASAPRTPPPHRRP